MNLYFYSRFISDSIHVLWLVWTFEELVKAVIFCLVSDELNEVSFVSSSHHPEFLKLPKSDLFRVKPDLKILFKKYKIYYNSSVLTDSSTAKIYLSVCNLALTKRDHMNYDWKSSINMQNPQKKTLLRICH